MKWNKLKRLKSLFVVLAEQNELAYETNCPIPCSFREYQTVGEPYTGNNFVFESNDERFQRWQRLKLTAHDLK